MTDTTRIMDEIRAALEGWKEPRLTCPHIDAMVENAALPPEAIAELDAIREINSQLRYGTWVLQSRAEAAEARVRELEGALVRVAPAEQSKSWLPIRLWREVRAVLTGEKHDA